MSKRPPSRSLTVVSGGSRERPPHLPSEDTRQVVVLGLLNGFDHDRIARLLAIGRDELERAYADEIATGVDRILIDEAANILRLARQRADLGVALRAGLALLSARLAAWGPQAAPVADPSLMPAEALSLEETEREIARLRTRRGPADS